MTQPVENQEGRGRRESNREQSAQAFLQVIKSLTGDKLTDEQVKELIQGAQSILSSGTRQEREEYKRERATESQAYPVAMGKWKDALGKGLETQPQFKDPGLRDNLQLFLDSIDQRDIVNPEALREWMDTLKNIRGTALQKNDPGIGQIDQVMENLAVESTRLRVPHGEYGSVQLTLTGSEISKMQGSFEGAEEVFESWVSAIEASNIAAHETFNETNSHKFRTAMGWLPSIKYPFVKVNGEQNTNPIEIEKRKKQMIDQFRFRIENHNMRIAMSHVDWKEVDYQSQRMGSACIFEAFRIKKANIAFNLYQRYFERYRLVYGKLEDQKDDQDRIIKVGEKGVAKWRITPEAVEDIKQKVKTELRSSHKLYGFKDLEEAEVAARIGYNLFESSMRMAVHVGRGQISRKEMEQVKGYRNPYLEPPFQSDPDEILANLYNPKQFMIDKWTRFGDPQKEILKRIMSTLGDKDMDVGEQEFMNVLAIVDYFSSPWRIQNLYDAAKERIAEANGKKVGELKPTEEATIKEQLDTIGTGLWLQRESPYGATKETELKKKMEKAEKRLINAARFRPLELLRAYAVTINSEGEEYSTGERHAAFQKMLEKGELNVGQVKINNYVKLEEVLGRYIYPIYEKAARAPVTDMTKPATEWKAAEGWRDYWKRIHGIDIANPKDEADKKLIRDIVSYINQQGIIPENEKLTAEELQALYGKVQGFMLDKQTIADLKTNRKHGHLYHKTLYMDDAPMGELEEEVEGLTTISKKLYEIEGGRRDPYSRMWGDSSAAAITMEHLMNAMTARDPHTLVSELKELANPLTGYAGRPPFQKLAFNVASGWTELTKADALWAWTGLANKVPWATSEGERLFGLSWPALDPKERRAIYEQIKVVFGDLKAEPGGKEIDAKVKARMGIRNHQVALFAVRMIALMFILTMLQETLKEMEEEDK